MTLPGLEPDLAEVESFDGTLLAARRMGADDGLPLLLVNAIGAAFVSWARTAVDLVRERPVVAWDHRGLLASGPAVTDRFDARAQAEDALAVMDHFGFEEFFVAAWSSGTRIALELAASEHERVKGLALVSGTYGHPASRLLRLDVAAALPVMASVGKYFARPLGGLMQRFVARPEIAGMVRQSGMVGATADTLAIVELLRGAASCDMKVLLETYQAVDGDSGRPLLEDITCPTLVVVGDRDPFTSASNVTDVASAIGSTQVITYEGATHYLPFEFPGRLSHDLRSFMAEVAPQPA
ncbi:MAG: alpha/beta hydrolase [Actinomycetota bacterium]|nr:alpha/beta hydrolase [Actinomycetota bacterium]